MWWWVALYVVTLLWARSLEYGGSLPFDIQFTINKLGCNQAHLFTRMQCFPQNLVQGNTLVLLRPKINFPSEAFKPRRHTESHNKTHLA